MKFSIKPFKWLHILFIKERSMGRIPFAYVRVGKLMINLGDVLHPFIVCTEFVRNCFPMFYSIGLRDCDSGGRVHAWFVEWGLNRWHMDRRLKRWDGAGDGEVYRRISLAGFIRAKRYERERVEHDRGAK